MVAHQSDNITHMLRPRPKSCKTGKNLCAKEAVLSIRLPRILLACMVGGCLATAGTSYQSVFRNPMAAPDILGAPSGACFGAAVSGDDVARQAALSRCHGPVRHV